MSHTFGVMCQYRTEHLSDTCPERDCPGRHGWTRIECPTPEDCQVYRDSCETCTPEDGPGYETLTTTGMTEAPTVHVHPAQVTDREPQAPTVIADGLPARPDEVERTSAKKKTRSTSAKKKTSP